MPRNGPVMFRSNQYKWRRHDNRYSDDSNDYLHRREQGNKGGDNRSGRRGHGNNTDLIKRAVGMNLLPNSGMPNNRNNNATSRNCGLSSGEIWVRITVPNGNQYMLSSLQDLINTIIGTQLRFFNPYIDERIAMVIMYAKVRQKEISNYRKLLQSARDPSTNTHINCEMTTIFEPRLPGLDDVSKKRVNNGDAVPVQDPSLPSEWIDALRSCFVQRFQINTRSLDLSNLHLDPSLLSQGLYLPLNKDIIVCTMINILRENQAQLAFLNLSLNRLVNLNAFKMLTQSGSGVVYIERIDLSGNNISSVTHLIGLRGIAGLTELDITETPLAYRFKSSDRALSSKLVQLLPSLKRLNGQDMPHSVQFAIEQNSQQNSNSNPKHADQKPLPPSVLGYFPNDDVKLALLSFLKLYFTRYDTKPRGENILPYYTVASQLVFSVACEAKSNHQYNSSSARIDTPSDTNSGAIVKTYLTTSRLLHSYVQKSRNLLRCRDPQRRRSLVARGSLAIASLLDEFPSTEHPLESLTVDVAYHSPAQILFTVTGVFYEISSADLGGPSKAADSVSNSPDKTIRKVLRCFTRTMTLVAPGGHVVQDDLIVANPSPALCRKYIRDVAAKARSHPDPSSNTPSTTVNNPPGSNLQTPNQQTAVPDFATQQLMIKQFSDQTKMNLQFSKQCLEEYGWNMNQAWQIFESMNARGKIPQVAFT